MANRKVGTIQARTSATEYGKKDTELRAFKIPSYLSLTVLLPLFVANAGAIGFDPSLVNNGGHSGLDAQIHAINIFNNNGKDPLVEISRSARGGEFAPIGRIRTTSEVSFKDGTYGHGLATGFLVGPCLIFTNYHAVFGESKTPNKTDFSVQFTANRTVIANPVSWGPANVRYNVASDWALLKLAEKDCIGNEVGWLLMLENPVQTLKNKSLLTAGYPIRKLNQAHPNVLWGQLKCSLKESATNDIFTNTLFNDCALSSGQSGSPLLVRNDEGQLRFIGMQAIDNRGRDEILRVYDMSHANIALDLFMGFTDERLAMIENDIKESKYRR